MSSSRGKRNPPAERAELTGDEAMLKLKAAMGALAPELGLDAAARTLEPVDSERLCALRDAYVSALFGRAPDEERVERLFELERATRVREMSAGGGARMVLDRLALAAAELRSQVNGHEACAQLWHACDLVTAWVRSDRLLAEERQRVSEFDAFAHEVSENVGATSSVLFVLAQATTPLDAAERALEAVRSAFAWDVGSYWTCADDGRLALAVSCGPSGEEHQKQRALRVARGSGTLGAAWERGDIAITQLDGTTRGELERELHARGMRALIALPVFMGERMVAVLSFAARTRFDLTESRKDVLRNVAILIASSLERMQQMGEVKELAANAEAVNAVLRRINLAQNATDAAQGALEAVREAFGCDFGACWVRPNGGRELVLMAQSGEQHEGFRRATREVRYVRGLGAVGRALLERDLVVVSDLGAFEGEPRAQAAREAGIRSGVCIPLLKQGEISGVIEVWLKHQTSFSELRREALRSVGSAVSSTLERLDERDAFARSLRDFASELMDVSSTLSGTTAEQSASAQELASAIGQVTATLSELRETSLEALRNAESVIGQAEVAFRSSASGRDSVGRAIDSMRAIREQVSEIAERILQLNDQTSQIGSIISTVNEISAQSKLLALNAAIEAARAGEHGRGFGVVASEIRSLAEQSKEATGQVRNILGEIQACTNAAVVAAEEGTKKSESGMALADLSGAKIQELARSMEESSSSARLIANSARQQSAGIEQVAQALIAISNATNSTATGLKQTEQATAQLLLLAERMASIVSIMAPERPLALSLSSPSNQNAAE